VTVRAIEIALLLGLVVLVAMPARRTGERFLVRWGVSRPTREQAAAAARYLRHRRLLYPICWVFGPALVLVVAALASPTTGTEVQRAWGLLTSVLAALLLAELVAALRPARGTTRSALLSQRHWRELVPWWAVAAHLAILGLAATQAAAALTAQSWAAEVIARLPPDQPRPRPSVGVADSWFVLVAAVLGVLAAYGVVLLAVRRRAEADPETDAILRTRSARVAVGVGIGLALGLLNQSNMRVADLKSLEFDRVPGTPPAPALLSIARHVDGWGMLLAVALGLAAWYAVAHPPVRPATPAAAR
jgi:hypothetical protein